MDERKGLHDTWTSRASMSESFPQLHPSPITLTRAALRRRRPLSSLLVRAQSELHWRASMAARWAWATTTRPWLPLTRLPAVMLQMARRVMDLATHPYEVCCCLGE